MSEIDIMLGKNVHQWQTLDMLPVFQEKVFASLKDAELTWLNLTSRPAILNNKTNESIIDLYEEQVDQLVALREQCQHWHRTDYLTPSQKESLLALEKAISRLEKLTQKILFIVRDFTDSPSKKKFTRDVLTLSEEWVDTAVASTTMTAKHIDVMKIIHDMVVKLAVQNLEGIEIFEATLDYLPMVNDIVSRHRRSVVMDYADRYPGFREYMILLEELSEKMTGVPLNFRSDA